MSYVKGYLLNFPFVGGGFVWIFSYFDFGFVLQFQHQPQK